MCLLIIELNYSGLKQNGKVELLKVELEGNLEMGYYQVCSLPLQKQNFNH